MNRRLPPENPSEWLNRARSSLIKAKNLIEGVYLEDLCFDAQQACEKAIKAVLIHFKIRFPYVHDLVKLLTLIEESGNIVPSKIKEAGILSEYAVETRYPSLSEPVSNEEYEKAVSIAEEVVIWAEGIVKAPSDEI